MFSKYDLNDPFTIKVFKFSDKIKKNDLEEYKQSFEEDLKSKKQFFIIFDISEVKKFKFNYMVDLLLFMYKISDDLKKLILANAIIANGITKSGIDIALKMKEPFCETIVKDNLDDGIKFLCESNVLNSVSLNNKMQV